MDERSLYPVQFAVAYPERDLDRLSTAFRLLAAIPIVIVLGSVSNGSWSWTSAEGTRVAATGAGGLLFFGPLLMIVFRQKYPRWWFDWNVALTAFTFRVWSYALLLRDEYPSTDEEQAVHLSIPYPNVPVELNRWLPLVKWLLAIPHYIVLFVLAIVTFIVMLIAWVAILITGRYPRSLFDFVVGVLRWSLRVEAYAFILVTDQYPPFSLAA